MNTEHVVQTGLHHKRYSRSVQIPDYLYQRQPCTRIVTALDVLILLRSILVEKSYNREKCIPNVHVTD